MALLNDLPNELIQEIVRQIPSPASKSRFGRTCQRFYDIARPEVYRSIKLDTDEPEDVFAFLIAALNHGHLVKKLTIVVHPARVNHSEQSWGMTAKVLTTLLHGNYPGQLTSLGALKFILPHDYSNGGRPTGSPSKSRHETLARVDHLLAAAAAGQPTRTITKLAIHNMPNRYGNKYNPPELYRSTAWLSFLSRVERFEVSPFTGKSEDHRDRERLVYSLREDFFKHMVSVKSLTFVGCPEYVVGHCHGNHKAPLFAVGGSIAYLPKLEDLNLVSTVVDISLVYWLANRPDNAPPLNLTLANTMCYDFQAGEADADHLLSCLRWDEAFDLLTSFLKRRAKQGKNSGIKTFTATFLDVCGLWGGHNWQLVKDIMERSFKEPERIVFPYVTLDAAGGLVAQNQVTRDAFVAGKDQVAYNRFMKHLAIANGQSA